MDKNELNQIISDIQNIKSHLMIFSTSYPDIMHRASQTTKAHLLVFKQSFTNINRLLDFVANILPSLTKMMEFLPNQKNEIPDAAEKLGKVTETTELATTEILDTVDNIMADLGDVLSDSETPDKTKDKLNNMNDKLFSIMDALQFQDITSQQIESIKAVLSEINTNLFGLVNNFLKNDVVEIDVKIGAFDSNASFNREDSTKKQEEIDRLFKEKEAGNRVTAAPAATKVMTEQKPAAPAPPPPSASPAPVKPAEKTSQDEIDALFNKPKQADPAPAAEVKAAPAEKTSQDEIDALFNKPKQADPAPAAEVKAAPAEKTSQDEIDALFSKPGKENIKEISPAPDTGSPDSDSVSQDDIDAMFKK